MLNVAVIGCGITGPAAALFLKKLSANVTVFDRVGDLRPVGAGFLLQPAGLDVLQQLGLLTSLLANGIPIEALHGLNHKGKLVLDLRYRDLVPHHTGLGMHRAVMYEALYQAMEQQGIEIINPCEITDVSQFEDSVCLKDNKGEQYGPFDCVILADGIRSSLRHTLFPKMKVTPYPWGALWAICADKKGQFGHILEQRYQRTNKMAGILPMGYQGQERLVSFFWSMHQSDLEAWRQMPLDHWKKEVLSLWPELDAFLDQFTTHEMFKYAGYADVRMYPWHCGRVVSIGDAAHGMSPQLGQGANLGLLDAMVLFECLQQNPVPEALALYSKQRKSQLDFYQTASRFVTPWFQSSSKTMGVLRDLLHGSFCKMPLIRRQMLLTLACMKTGYY